MGAQSSKLNKVLSRTSTTDSTTSSFKEKKAGLSSLQRDLVDLSLTSDTKPAYGQRMYLADHSSGALTDHDNSQLTGESITEAKTESAVSSKSNLSSFLNSILNKNRDSNDTHEGEDMGDKSESDRRMSDLREQKQQKKINRINQKKQEKARRQEQLNQRQKQTPPPASYPLAVASTCAPSSPSFHATTTASSLQGSQQSTITHRAKSATNIFSTLASSTPHLSTVLKTLPSSESNGIILPKKERDPMGLSPSLVTSRSLQESRVVDQPSSAPPNSLSPTPPNSKQSSAPLGRPSKLSFIRGKASFAWLEKRLPPAASDLDEETLNDSSWAYQQSQLLNEMEIEAAKGYVDRITEQHYLYKDVMAGNYHAPIDLAFKRVLENGCGAGDWTLDMASEMPETDFVGCPQIMFTTSNAEKSKPIIRPRGLLGADQSQQGSSPASSSSPTSVPAAPASGTTSTTASTLSGSTIRPNIRPRNCFFHPDVPLNRLPFQNEQFDFVYQRRQSVVLMSTEWQRTILELFRVLKRGGWVEILEPDLFLRGGGELCQLAGEYCVGIFEAMGRNPNVIHEMEHLLENAGFVNVSVKVWSIPLGWGGVIGQAMLANQKQFVNELEPIYVRQGHGDSQEYKDLTGNIFNEAVEKKAYINYHVVLGQKPASASDRLLHQMHRQKDEQF
ncbi:hypothetical protein BGZ67_007435 [Mortierella alpina]|nr:hypothetical protein BGZ67_007435 [Mortierella alpina]